MYLREAIIEKVLEQIEDCFGDDPPWQKVQKTDTV